MGLFGIFSSSTKTKSEWDREILRLTKKLEEDKLSLQYSKRINKGKPNYAYLISHPERRVAETKMALAEAKMRRKEAPKG